MRNPLRFGRGVCRSFRQDILIFRQMQPPVSDFPTIPAPLIGVDMVEPDRLGDRLARTPTLRKELFLSGELEYCDAQNDPTMHLAARFCAKEAVKKALGLDAWDPLDIEVVDGAERVHLRLHADALRRAEELGVEVTISLSHLPSMAIAVALAQSRDIQK
jgi:phosphopantethiene--protein transferase domain